MSWILNVVVIMLCVGATIWGWKRSKGTIGWINRENYQYIITALLLMAYGMLAYLLGDESSLFRGFHLSNTMTALALGIITLAKMIVELKMEMDQMEVEEVQGDGVMGGDRSVFEDMDEEMKLISQKIIVGDQQDIVYNEVSYEVEDDVMEDQVG